jgi:hypothetical protein
MSDFGFRIGVVIFRSEYPSLDIRVKSEADGRESTLTRRRVQPLATSTTGQLRTLKHFLFKYHDLHKSILSNMLVAAVFPAFGFWSPLTDHATRTGHPLLLSCATSLRR